MRIVVDMQGAQSIGSRARGIGRYSMAFSQALARQCGEHEVILALSCRYPDTIEPIRAAFYGLMPQGNIRVWDAPSSLDYRTAPKWRRDVAELIREHFIADLKPDAVLITSLFEGFDESAVTSIGKVFSEIPTAVVHYDLIPLIYRATYLKDPAYEAWYLNKLDHFRRAGLFLSISESSRQEAIRYLGLAERSAINISTAVDEQFSPRNVPPARLRELQERLGLKRPFVMYSGGIERRKNIEALIRAYAGLSEDIRRQHQLAVVCTILKDDRSRLVGLAEQCGLTPDDFIFTGFVPDDDLIDLYNLCTVFVFPSWHEGFGLPALEAMSCGAAVIGANTSTLPELIGREDALFDPHDDNDITAKLAQVLTDASFRQTLARYGLEQAKRFSWRTTAERALSALEQWRRGREKPSTAAAGPRPKLAYISPLPPDRSGISDYSVELLPELSRHYDIDVVVVNGEVQDPFIKAVFPTRTVDWFRNRAQHYDQVLYHIGNSSFHQHMFGLLREIPGVVVLHDFFLGNIAEYMSARGATQNGWVTELYASHGYEAVQQLFHTENHADIAWRYPCNLSVLQQAQGIIVHSENSIRLAGLWYGELSSANWAVIPFPRASHVSADKAAARKALGIGTSDFLVCAFGVLGPIKLNLRLLQAWLELRLALDVTCHLVFVGENDAGRYGEELLAAIRHNSAARNVRITGWVDIDAYRQCLAAADVAVQLRSFSRGETSAAVFDCMNYGLPTIVNAHGSMADLDDDAVYKLPDEFSDAQLKDALETLWKDVKLRKSLALRAREIILEKHSPRACAERYREAIERFSITAATGTRALVSAIAGLDHTFDKRDLPNIAEAIARSMPRPRRVRQLFVDVSELVQRDLKSGVQRVVRGILKDLLSQVPAGYRIEPVYAALDRGYRYARRFTLEFLSCPVGVLSDEPVEYAPGDVFFGLDIQTEVIPAQRAFYQELRRHGVRVLFLVYDLLCIQMPQHFEPVVRFGFTRWLKVVAESDGAICISKTVAEDLAGWFEENGPALRRPFKIYWCHIGADIENSAPTKGLPANAQIVLDRLRGHESFLMVGTLEPRKGHAKVLEAFETLWKSGLNVNLAIVGRHGWMMEGLVEGLRSHPELNKRLFWFENISDEYLEKIYAVSACLIAASEGEGFGLPLIEAARHKLPIIARDLPVFREVAGENAFYCVCDRSDALAAAIREWLALHSKGMHPKSDNMPWITWAQSVERLRQILLADDGFEPSKTSQDRTEAGVLPGEIVRSLRANRPARQFLLDISATCRTNLKTGIERVAHAVMLGLLKVPPDGFRVQPVYLSDEGGAWHYRYARRFVHSQLGLPSDVPADEAVEPHHGDVLLGLDFSGQMLVQAEAAGLFAEYRDCGVAVYFTIFDLLPLRLPQYFPRGSADDHEKWLRAVLNTDGALCISRTVADDLRAWVEPSGSLRQRPFRIGWFPLGADIANAVPTRGLPEDAAQALAALAARPSFLMVGTIEPRKGHLQVLEAFDRLWSEGVDVNLAIVGAEGWRNVPPPMRRTIPQILTRLHSHPERTRRLFWINEPSDEYLEKIYATSSCLIAAAEGEGFGLPLIEAARNRVPIIARDIPIFREVAGGHAFYFTGHQAEALAAAIKEWLTLYRNGKYPKSDAMPWMTWAQSVERLKDVVLRGDWYATIPSEGRQARGSRAWPGEREFGVGAEVAPR